MSDITFQEIEEQRGVDWQVAQNVGERVIRYRGSGGKWTVEVDGKLSVLSTEADAKKACAEAAIGDQIQSEIIVPIEPAASKPKTPRKPTMTKAESPRPQAHALLLYEKAGFRPVLLNRWSAKRADVPVGKTPRDKGWRTRDYTWDEARAWMAEGGNVGLKLQANELVLDVDPRNFPEGRDVLAELVAKTGLDLDSLPHSTTGSGGHHYLMHKDPGVLLRVTLEDFPGIDLKSVGGQTLCAGSVHPNGQHYEWDVLGPAPSEAPFAPQKLLDLYARPASKATEAGGQLSPEELESCLSALNPEDFRDHDKWFALMCSCHHATNGMGMDEFLDWSTRDPNYAQDRQKIARRWESLHGNHQSAVTVRTLLKHLVDAGRADLIPHGDAAEDFEGEPSVEPLKGEEGENPVLKLIRELNEDYCAVLHGGQFLVFKADEDPAFDPPRQYYQAMKRDAFTNYLANKKVRLADSKSDIPVARLWLEHPNRRSYEGIILDPTGKRAGKKRLNIWRGWGVKPVQGDWSAIRDYIETIMASGNKDYADYILRWFAFMLQEPDVRPEVALVFRGDKGAGKSTLGQMFGQVAGSHSFVVSSTQQFAGRFNAHLRNTIFLFADEAYWPGDRIAEGAVKMLVTEKVIPFEDKGVALVNGPNLVHLMIASNNRWVAPASEDERRFAVFDVSNEQAQNSKYFGALWEHANSGGLAAMVYDLMNMSLGGWHPRDDIPQTEALAEQKLESMKPVYQWWRSLLEEGALPIAFPGDWSGGPVELNPRDKEAMVRALGNFLREHRFFSASASQKMVVESGKKLGLVARRNAAGTERVWVLPDLEMMRIAFENLYGAGDLFE